MTSQIDPHTPIQRAKTFVDLRADSSVDVLTDSSAQERDRIRLASFHLLRDKTPAEPMGLE